MDERRLIERCVDGDEVAWERLYDEYGPRVARFVGHMLASGEDIDDLVQQVFVELLVSLPRFRGEASLTTWLYRIANRVVLHHLRSRRRTKRRVEALAVATEAHAPRAPSAHERTEARAELRAVLAAAETLPPDVRAVWIMREIEGLSSAEVASALDTREGTVRSRLFAARRAIVAELGRMGVEMPASPPAEGEAAGPGGRAAARGSAGAQVASGTGREDGREPQPAPARPRPAVAESSSDRAHIPADRVRVV